MINKHLVIDARNSGTSTGRYTDKLIEYLQKIDTENRYTVIYSNQRINAITLSGKNFTKVSTKYKEFTFGEQIGFAIQLYKLKADLVHYPLVQHPILYLRPSVIGMLDLTTLRFRNPSKNPVVFWVKQRVYWFVNWVASHKAKRIIAISNYVKSDILKSFRINPDKIVVTHNSADFISDKPVVVNELSNKQFIMYVGRHQPHKNLPRLIEAHQKLLVDNPDLLLAIVGKKDRTTELLEQDAMRKGYKNILYTGFVSDAQLRWMYENTSCYVFPSLSEGFGLPGLEAMVHGAPVASSNATCLPEIYGDAARYFDPLDVDDIAKKIQDILSNKKLTEDLVSKGKEQVKKYRWQRMAEQTLKVYESVLKSDR